MAIKTYQQQLEEVQVAIAKAEEAQSYGVGNRNLARANLKTLYDREKYLRVAVARDAGGGKIALGYVVPE